MAKFRYLGMTVTNQHHIYEEIMSRLNSGIVYHHSVDIVFSAHLLFENFKV